MGTLRTVLLGIVGVLLTLGVAAVPPAVPVSGDGVTIAWTIRERTMGDGRSYFVRAPDCWPRAAPECVAYLGRERPVVVFFHGARAAEDLAAATPWLSSAQSWSPETIFVFAVSKDGSGIWDGGWCCTPAPVDDVGYLARVVGNLALRWTVDRDRVGVSGLSNGAMIALRAACERPDLIAAAVAMAGTYDGPCSSAPLRIGQWHGAQDRSIPLEGGTYTVRGQTRTLPPVTALSERMAPRSLYELRIDPAQAHSITWADYREATLWLVAQLAGAPARTTGAVRPVTAETATFGWSTARRTLPDGRGYFIRAPVCEPVDADACVAALARPRALVFWLHAAMAPEDIDTATSLLDALGAISRDTILVYGLSKDGTRRFDSGVCCTTEPVDEPGYLAAVVDDVAGRWAVDRARVGAIGFSNGGMLALRAACERPDLIRAAASLAGSYGGACDTGPVRAVQLHGARDTSVPLNGGTVWILGRDRVVPPAALLSQRMASGSVFELRVRPALGHVLPWGDYKIALRWLETHYRR